MSGGRDLRIGWRATMTGGRQEGEGGGASSRGNLERCPSLRALPSLDKATGAGHLLDRTG